MQLLFADSLPQNDHRRARGTWSSVCGRSRPGRGGPRGPHPGVRHPRRAQHQGQPKGVFAAADRLALVIRAGAGTNTIDTAAAAARGVLVANVPGRNSAAVAELTMGLLLAIDRRIPDNVADLRAGRWNKKTLQQGRRAARLDDGHRGARLHRVGRGRAGRRVRHQGAGAGEARSCGVRRGTGRRARHHHARLARGADLDLRHRLPARAVLRRRPDIWSTRPSSATCAPARSCSTPHEATSSTRPPCSRRSTPGRSAPAWTSTATNPAPAPRSGSLRWPSTRMSSGTHHIGASTQQAQLATAAGVVEIVDAFVAGEARNCVNLAAQPARVRDADRPPSRPAGRARAGPRPVERGRAERRAHGEPGVPRRRGGDGLHRRRRVPPGRAARRRSAPSRTCSVSPRRRSQARVGRERRRQERSSVVRPFRARIVRQECAAQNVSQMLDALPAVRAPRTLDARRGPRAEIDPDAYDESAAALYVYRLRRGDDEHVGVVGEVSAEAFVDGQVRGHEAVQPDRVEALVDHFTAAAARSELVALLHRPGPGVVDAVAETLRSHPVIRFTGPDGWEQTVWRVPGPVAEVLSEELSDGRALHRRRPPPRRRQPARVAAGRTTRRCRRAVRHLPARRACVCWPSTAGSPARCDASEPAGACCPTPSTSATSPTPTRRPAASGCTSTAAGTTRPTTACASPGAAGLDIAILNDAGAGAAAGPRRAGGHSAGDRLRPCPP